MVRRFPAAHFAMLVVSAWFAPGSAAEPPPPRDWDLALFTYVWAAGVEADVETRAGDVAIDQDFVDILGDLELGGMALVDARWRRLVLIFDAVYTKTGDESDVLGGLARADVDLTQVILDAKLGFRVLDVVAPWGDASAPDAPRVLFDLLAGARYWYNGADVDLNGSFGGFGRHFSPSNDWVDPVAGVRVGAEITRSVGLSVVADVGGLAIGDSSEFTWLVMPSLNWRAWDRVSVHVGYKHLGVERKRPRTNNDVDYTMSGPFLGLGFHF